MSEGRYVASLLLVMLAPLATTGAQATCDARIPTRQTGPGPHDFTSAPDSDRLWHDGDAGEPLFLRARVLDTCGRPVAGARVRILHANQDGVHEADRWRAHLETDERGRFRVITVYPGYAGDIPRHVHFVIEHPDHQRLVTRLFFKNDPVLGGELDDLAVVPEAIRSQGRTGYGIDYEFVLAPR